MPAARPPSHRRATALRTAAAALLLALLAAACGSASGTPASPTTSAEADAPPTTSAPRTTSTSTTSTSTTSTSTTTSTTSTTAPATTTTAPPTTAPAPPPLRTPTPEQPLRTLIIGDSTAYEVGYGIVRANDPRLQIEVLFKTSSGLARPDFFDWGFYLGWVADNNPPELMLLSLGANDGQPLTAPDGTVHQVHTDGWRAEYLRRVDEVSRRITAAGTRLYWIAQPMSSSDGYNAAMALVNGVYREVADRTEHVEVVDIFPALADADGNYQQSIPGPDGQPVEIRASDGIHLTATGGDLAARSVLDRLATDWGE